MPDHPVPVRRIDTEPHGAHLTVAERLVVLHNALRGVDLGGHDERIADWLTRWEPSTVMTIASWLERARLADRAEAVALVRADLDGAQAQWRAILGRGPRVYEDAYHKDGLRAAIAVLGGQRMPCGTDGGRAAR